MENVIQNQSIHGNEFIRLIAAKVDAMVTHITMLETQISQVAQQEAYTRAPSRIILGKP